MDRADIMRLIEEDVHADIHGDLYGHDRVADIIASYIERLQAKKIEPCAGCTDYRRFSRMED